MDPAPVQLHEGADDRQAEADPAMPRAESMALEPVEHRVGDLLRHAAPVIPHAQQQVLAAAAGMDLHALPGLREADRVREQVEQDLADPFPVGVDAADILRHVEGEGDARFGEPVLDAAHRGLDGGLDVHVLALKLQRAGID